MLSLGGKAGGSSLFTVCLESNINKNPIHLEMKSSGTEHRLLLGCLALCFDVTSYKLYDLGLT